MSDFKDRLKIELSELTDKTIKLETFIESENFNKIDEIQQSLLDIQKNAMMTYIACLDKRIKYLN